jgi:ATP/ADP translocase
LGTFGDALYIFTFALLPCLLWWGNDFFAPHPQKARPILSARPETYRSLIMITAGQYSYSVFFDFIDKPVFLVDPS